jgi:sec-independent protein translocase protein TatA
MGSQESQTLRPNNSGVNPQVKTLRRFVSYNEIQPVTANNIIHLTSESFTRHVYRAGVFLYVQNVIAPAKYRALLGAPGNNMGGNTMGFLKDIGPMELIVILLIVVMVFGVGKLPDVAASLGKSLRSFREGQSGTDEDETKAVAVRRPRRKSASTVKASTANVSTAEAAKAAPKVATERPASEEKAITEG